MTSSKKILESAKVLANYCEEQKNCQNCILRVNYGDHWKCGIRHIDLIEIESNIEAKKKNGGYI